MRSLNYFTDVYLCRRYVDFRMGINGLSAFVRDQMDRNPFSGAVFIFCCRSRDKIKILYWDRSGFALWQKRLEKDKFHWPRKLEDDVISIEPQTLEWLLDGFDITRMKPHETLHYEHVS